MFGILVTDKWYYNVAHSFVIFFQQASGAMWILMIKIDVILRYFIFNMFEHL